MKPKEKALELIKKFSPLVIDWDYYWDIPRSNDEILIDTKKCALITVEEILSILFQHHEIDYWKQVKSEIELL